MRRVRALTQPAPAAGQDFNLLFSQSEPRRIHSVIALLTTSATVANRLPQFALVDPGGVVGWEVGPSAALAASSASGFVISPTFGSPAAITSQGVAAVGLAIPDMVLPPGWTFASRTAAIAAGDQWSSISYIVEQYDSWSENERAIVGAYEQMLATGNAG